MKKTCIIGAGISGLALAWQLKRNGADCTVLETSVRTGGAMQSYREGEYLAEEGPNSILINSAQIDSFLASIPGLQQRIIEAKPEAKKRFIVRDGRPQVVPTNPLSAITSQLWSFPGKIRVLKEPFVRPAPADIEESVADFVRRRLGDELYRYAINPLVGGIYAGDPEQLSLRYGFPKLYALEQQHGGLIRGAVAKLRAMRKAPGPKVRKRIISFREGMGELPEKLATALGDAISTGVSIKSIQFDDGDWSLSWTAGNNVVREARFDELIVAVPAHRPTELPFPEPLRKEMEPLSKIEYPPVSVLSLGFKRADIAHPLDGFGALVPEAEGRSILGVLFPSSLFPGRAPDDEVLLTVFVGGSRQPELATADTEKLKPMVLAELEQLLGLHGSPTFTHHTHWIRAIPQYKLGYGTYLKTMDAIEHNHPGLRLVGNYRTGISVSYCLEAALNYK